MSRRRSPGLSLPARAVLDCLNSWPCTWSELVEETGLAASTISEALAELRGLYGWSYERREETCLDARSIRNRVRLTRVLVGTRLLRRRQKTRRARQAMVWAGRNRAGETLRAIAASEGITVRAVWNAILKLERRLGFRVRPQRRRYVEDEGGPTCTPAESS